MIPQHVVEEHEVILRDGRLLAAYTYGQGPVVLYHHGTPGTGLTLNCARVAADQLGVTVLSYDRAGYARSDANPGRSIASVATDMEDLLNHFHVDSALTVGWSGGGPHALATAHFLPERIQAVCVIAGVGPSDVDDLNYREGLSEAELQEFELAVSGREALLEFAKENYAPLATLTREDVQNSLTDRTAASDRAFLEGDYCDELVEHFRRALEASVEGMTDDAVAFSTPWGFDVSNIQQEMVIFHGALDRSVPIRHGQWLAKRVPHAVPRFFDEDGHTSIAIGRMTEAISELLSLSK